MLKAAKENEIVVLSKYTPSSRLSGEISAIQIHAYERTSIHGVLMDIYGMGVLIQDSESKRNWFGIGEAEGIV